MLTTTTPKLAIVVPCYNEEEALLESNAVLTSLLNDWIKRDKVKGESFICYVDDGSADRTWSLIQQLSAADGHVRGLKLSRNFGHQYALLSGMLHLREEVDCIVTIDADLQDDPKCIEPMLEHYAKGCEIVYGVRDSRDSDTFAKRWTAQLFYRLMDVMGVKTIYNHADFRMVSRSALNELARYPEANMFLRGVFPQIGFKSATVSYDRQVRTAGTTKFSFPKMLAFAWDGITSFSPLPLRLIFALGCLILIVSMLLCVWALIPVFQGRAIHGWASTVIPIFIFSGFQMVSVGVLGEYLAKVYQEIKARPRYIIEQDTLKSKLDRIHE